MLDEKDLQAIAQLMDLKMAQQKQEIIGELDVRMGAKLTQQKSEITGDLDAKLTALESRMDDKLSAFRQETVAMMEAYFDPKFELLADGLAAINEKLKALPDPDLLDRMQEELDLHHELLKQHTREIKALKKAQ